MPRRHLPVSHTHTFLYSMRRPSPTEHQTCFVPAQIHCRVLDFTWARPPWLELSTTTTADYEGTHHSHLLPYRSHTPINVVSHMRCTKPTDRRPTNHDLTLPGRYYTTGRSLRQLRRRRLPSPPAPSSPDQMYPLGSPATLRVTTSPC